MSGFFGLMGGVLLVAGITASYGDGYQFQALFYVLIFLMGGFVSDVEATLILTFIHLVACYISGIVRSTTKT